MPQTKLWEMATYEMKPRLNRLDGVATVMVQGGQEPEFHITPDPAKLLTAGVTVTDILDAVRRTNLIDSPGLLERNHQLVLGLVSGQVRTPEEIAQRRGQKHAGGNSRAHRRCGQRGARREAGLHHRHRQRKARGAAEHQPPARQQHGAGGERSSRRNRAASARRFRPAFRFSRFTISRSS